MNKTPLRFFIMVLVGIGFLWSLYVFFGHQMIAQLYNEKSWTFFNQLLEGRKVHPLEFYLAKGDRMAKYFIIFISCAALLIGFISFAVRSKFKSMNKFFKNVLILSLSVLLSLSLAEVAVRKMGIKPRIPAKEKIQITPGNHLVKIDPLRGYTTIAGQYQATLPDGYTFTMTNIKDGERITHPLGDYENKNQKPEIWIFGCSFTFGWSLNDQETYAWLLQKDFPDYEVVNFGIVGYGTLQSFIDFQEALKTHPKPAVVIYAYASFHDERNTFLLKRRQAVGSANELGAFRQPFARMDKTGSLIYSETDPTYHEFPLVRQSALARLIEDKINDTEDQVVHSRAVTEKLIENFSDIAKKNGIPFVVAGIDSESTETLEFLKHSGIKTVDISVDLTKKENRNWPHDSHPNAAANQEYAEKLKAFLKAVIKNG